MCCTSYRQAWTLSELDCRAMIWGLGFRAQTLNLVPKECGICCSGVKPCVKKGFVRVLLGAAVAS